MSFDPNQAEGKDRPHLDRMIAIELTRRDPKSDRLIAEGGVPWVQGSTKRSHRYMRELG